MTSSYTSVFSFHLTPGWKRRGETTKGYWRSILGRANRPTSALQFFQKDQEVVVWRNKRRLAQLIAWFSRGGVSGRQFVARRVFSRTAGLGLVRDGLTGRQI